MTVECRARVFEWFLGAKVGMLGYGEGRRRIKVRTEEDMLGYGRYRKGHVSVWYVQKRGMKG